MNELEKLKAKYLKICIILMKKDELSEEQYQDYRKRALELADAIYEQENNEKN